MTRKVALISLLIFAIVLVGIGIVIVLQISQNPILSSEGTSQSTNTDDIEVAGFGSTADTSNFAIVEQAFAAPDCTWYLDQAALSNSGNSLLDEIAIQFSHGRDRELEIENDYAKNCFYYFYDANENHKIMQFYVKAYNEDSVIDNSAEELYERINTSTITRVIEEGTFLSQVNYSYGESIIEDSCQMNLFHEQNDFEYASIVFNRFGTCDLFTGAAREVGFSLSEKLEKIMFPFLLEESS